MGWLERRAETTVSSRFCSYGNKEASWVGPVGEWMGNFALYWTDAACRPRARCWVYRDEEEVLSALRGLVSRGEGNVSSCNTQL